MKILDKNEINEKLGAYGIFSGKAGNTLLEELEYLGGLPDLDKLIESGKIAEQYHISLNMRPKGVEIFTLCNLGKVRMGLLLDQINYWTYEQKEEVAIKKSKSVVGRALLGGVLFGPAGAIVGGMTGLGEKK